MQGECTKMGKALRAHSIPAVPHGFRSSFRDWAGELSGAAHDVIELSLAHAVANKVEAAYARSYLLELRRKLMRGWADYLKQGGV